VKKLLFLFLIFPLFVSAQEIEVKPKNVFQGDPVAIFLDVPVSEISSGTFLDKKLFFFTAQSKTSALIPISPSLVPATYPIIVTLKNGLVLNHNVVVSKRVGEVFVLPIPPQLGENTPQNQTKVITKLIDENKILSEAYYRHMRPLWTKEFRQPVLNPVVTDLYGTVRETGVYSVTHRGTDFRASIGTDVYPINRGVVRFAGTLPTYGKAVIVDHGLGITSLYLHLSKIHVVVGQLALPTQIIGKSGDTGFSGGPHLHLSIKIDGVSIDPETFLVLFK
jgi:murein DD-endopeptidase MepM/ murein hydrolase activator NlpD